MNLHLLYLPVRARLLMLCGRECGLVDDRQAADLGYLLHGLFKRLAEKPPMPFAIQTESAGRGETFGRLPVLAYSAIDHTAFREAAHRLDDGAALGAIDWERADSKQMPDLDTGRTVGFRVRVCPAIRIGRRHPRLQPGAEVDPYLALLERAYGERLAQTPDADARTLRRAVIAEQPARETVYGEWLAARCGGAARLLDLRLVAQRDAALWRKGEPKAGPARVMYERPRRRHGPRSLIGRREAVFEGTLRVADAAQFARLLARGLGRHRAFGFGMLLLRPAVHAEG